MVFVFPVAHLFAFALYHDFNVFFLGIISFWESLLGPCSRIISHSWLTFQLDSIVGVVAVTLVETLESGLINLCILPDWIWIPFPDLLKLYVHTLLQNHLPWSVQGSIHIKPWAGPRFNFFFRFLRVFSDGRLDPTFSKTRLPPSAWVSLRSWCRVAHSINPAYCGPLYALSFYGAHNMV